MADWSNIDGFNPIRSKGTNCVAAQLLALKLPKTVQDEPCPAWNSDIRRDLFYRFATKIQKCKGRGNQVFIPVCVLRVVRRVYPDFYIKQTDDSYKRVESYDN